MHAKAVQELILDEAVYGALCQTMVEKQLRPRGVEDQTVLNAMRATPRHHFVNEGLRRRAYTDCALPTMNEQTISQPLMVGLMSQALNAKPGQRVLEIGTGSGYQTLVLFMMGLKVVSVERDAALADWARERLQSLGVKGVEIIVGDGSADLGYHESFDRVLVTAGATATCPPALREALKVGGRMVIPMGDRSAQNLMTLLRGEDETSDVWRRGLACRFVPLIGEAGWADPWG